MLNHPKSKRGYHLRNTYNRNLIHLTSIKAPESVRIIFHLLHVHFFTNDYYLISLVNEHKLCWCLNPTFLYKFIALSLAELTQRVIDSIPLNVNSHFKAPVNNCPPIPLPLSEFSTAKNSILASPNSGSAST